MAKKRANGEGRDFAVFGVPPYRGCNRHFTALTTIGMWSSTLQKLN